MTLMYGKTLKYWYFYFRGGDAHGLFV